jgi:hypothetical protein
MAAPPPRTTPAAPSAVASEENPFLARLPRESSRAIDLGWLAPDDAADVAPPRPEPEAAAPPAPPATATPEEIPAEPEPSKALPSPAKRSRAKALALVFLAMALVAGGGYALRSRGAPRTPTVDRATPRPSVEPPAAPTALAAVAAPPPTHTAEPPPSASAAKKKPAGAKAGDGASATPSASADPATQGILDATALPPGRRIVVDGRVVGTSPRRVPVRCGTHRVQIGDLPPESIAFPCGGEVSFTD